MILREYVYLDDQRLALFDLTNSDAIFYYINDHLGTAQILLDGQGVVVWQGNYKPFGEVDVAVNNVANYFRFSGQIFDIESGLHYNWNRYYNPEIGRYISADPIGLDGGLNLFAYVSGNPVNWGDPNGEYSDPTGKYTKPISRPGIPPPNVIGRGTSLGTILATPVSATPPAIVVAVSIGSFGVGYGLTSLAIDGTYLDGGLGNDLYDLLNRCEDDKKGKYMCEGYGKYEQIGTNKNVIWGTEWIIAYRNNMSEAIHNWTKKAQSLSLKGFTARHIKPKKCKK